MGSLSAIGFLNPWVLAGLLALPILWWLLRAIPPSPRRQPFAPVRLLLGLEDEEREADRTPWWLLALRILAIAAALVGFSQPILNPTDRLAAAEDGPLLLVMDGGWASAPDWADRQAAASGALDEAAEAGRPVVFWSLAEPDPTPEAAPAAARRVLEGAAPQPWAPDRAALLAAFEAGEIPAPGQTIWIHDGIDHGAEEGGTAALAEALADAAPLTLIGPARTAPALTPARLDEGRLAVDVLRTGGPADEVRVAAIVAAPGGAERRAGVATASFGPGDTRATATFDLPRELVQEVTRLVIDDGATAAGAVLATGAIRRVRAAIVAPEAEAATPSLTSPAYYLERAMVPWADLRQVSLAEALEADVAAILLADQGDIPDAEREALEAWVDEGGLLIRFAGPRLAAALDARFAVADEDPLLPVRLRRGGRVLGGALSWSAPKSVGAFPETGPFRGLTPPDEVDVRTQVLADPGPDLARRTWAALDDGTPLVTARTLGAGHVVLFHVTADAEWSSLPLSGLFVEMLGRLMVLAPGQVPEPPSAEALEGTVWRAGTLIGTDGAPRPGSALDQPVAGERIAARDIGPGMPPGLYARADGGPLAPGEATEIVLSMLPSDGALAPFPEPPAGTVVETLGGAEAIRLDQWFLLAALALALADILATLWISGRLSGLGLRRPKERAGFAGAALLAAALGTLLAPAPAAAQSADPAVEATAETTLAYLLTGDDRIDRVSRQAMVGLGNALTLRTAVEPGPPVGLTPETDVLAFYPVIYWPLTARTVPSEEGLARLADYLAGGGMLVIDTQNGASGFGAASATEMRRIARALNLPPLEPVDDDHVIARAFYLLEEFPGRWRGGTLWAEAGSDGGPEDDEAPDLPSFDRVDDNVTPVLVGSADWAAAWAVDETGRPAFAIGRAGDRQRELALRFGINLVMYALTGNYKSDQVHAPEVLRRLGQ